MLLELMSNGILAELPPENAPSGIKLPEEPSVMLLLPHNKYLLGTFTQPGGKWIYADSSDRRDSQNVSLYDDEVLSLINEGTRPTILPGKTVTALRKELFMLSEPPGNYHATVSMLRTFMRYHPVFSQSDSLLPDEKYFYAAMKDDEILCKAYWSLRFALSRNEMETVGRLKSWLRAGPETFIKPECKSHIWFSITDMPDSFAVSELESLSFSAMELKRMSAQNVSPLLIYNPKSGWLILGRFGRDRGTIFFVWVYLNHEIYTELREHKRMSVHDIIYAVWGEYETEQAMIERMKYKGAGIPQ